MTTPTTNHNPAPWTDRQGQYLAFIYAYTTIHRHAPAERDMQHFFRTTPPSVHNMIKLKFPLVPGEFPHIFQ